MKKIKGMKYYFIAAAIALLAVFVAAPAGAGGLDRRLYGDYAYNVAATCAHAVCGINAEEEYDCQDPSTRGFNPATLALRVPGSQRSYGYNLQTVINFNGHGNFTLKGEVLAIRSSLGTAPPDIPANQVDLGCDGTYEIKRIVDEGNGLFVDITFAGCIGKVTSGLFGVLGFTQKISGPVIVRGRLDTVTGSSSVIISNTIPYIEEIEVTACPGYAALVGMKEQRICNNTGTMVKLSPWHWFSK